MSTGTATADILAAYELEPAGEGRFRAGNARSTHGVVFGGQLLGQALLAAQAGHPGMPVKTLHAVFARAASFDADLDIEVEPVHGGRSFASSTVTIRQGDRTCVRAQVLLSADEPDCIRHAAPAPAHQPPEDDDASPEWQVRIVDDIDINDPALVGPPELDVWTRFVGAPDDPARNQALLAFATDGFLIGTAMRPHEGVGQAQAHRTLSTGVISHTVTFHEPVDAGAWNLLSHRSPYAGHGRSYGTADVFDADGRLVASFVQDAMIRPRDPSAGTL
ncbi:MAG TPA: acyl-CoA thioesterase domain-containing protein [Acidimicrobiales bacterium]|nr:acyl-CoA thioesterase domain-containing protein [Acidimicrobiales bacterium]